jgi:formamidopyrimidine-DNA glycosylase
MPEGHTIHRAARDHARDLAGQRVKLSSPQGRFDVEALADADGRARLLEVEAHGKHLFYRFETGHFVHVHLGLFGKFRRHRCPAPAPRASTRLRLEGDAVTLDLVGPTASEVMTLEERLTLTARLGPDPLRPDADPRRFYAYLARARAPIGAILLDQSRICGVGNVYRAEVLHLLGVHPETPGAALAPAEARALWRLVVGLLRRGVEERRIVTTRGLRLATPRERVPRAESTHVYRRRQCRTCGGDVERQTLRARPLYFCGTCQPPRAPARDEAPESAAPEERAS